MGWKLREQSTVEEADVAKRSRVSLRQALYALSATCLVRASMDVTLQQHALPGPHSLIAVVLCKKAKKKRESPSVTDRRVDSTQGHVERRKFKIILFSLIPRLAC